jgi:hypothetical protein
MKKEELKTNDLLIFTTLLNEASKWLYALQLKGLKQEVKWVFNNALKALQSYERILKKNAGNDVLEIQDDVSESFSDLLIKLSKMDVETQNKFSQHIANFFNDENILTK